MTGLWITLGIIAFIVLALYVLLHISLHAYVDVSKNGVYIIITYLGIKLWSTDDSMSHKPNSCDKEEEPPVQSDNKPAFELTELEEVNPQLDAESSDSSDSNVNNDNNSDKESNGKLPEIKDKIAEYKPYFPVAKKALAKLLKMIRIRDLDVSVTVGDSDACKAGEKFGNVNALFYSALGLLCCLFSVKIKHTEVNCDFTSNKVDGSLKTSVLVRPSAFLCLVGYLGINYLRIKKHTNREKIKEIENNERKES